MDYQEVLEYLYNSLPMYHRVGAAAYKTDITNTVKLMNALKHPERSFKAIHVAGTNGKGSVSHFLASVLRNSGYKVGLYTSPHLVDFRERIRINGEMIPEEYVAQFVNDHKSLFEEIEPSFFEMTVGMAFSYFREQMIDIAVVEVGMGGRLDSTNIISPVLSIITNIGIDHTQYLGNSLEAIAAEKAGIIKQEVPVVIGETQSATQRIFAEKAKELNAPIFFADNSFRVEETEQSTNNYMQAVISKNDEYYSDIKTPLSGKYQLKNLATVSQAVDILKQIGYNNITDTSFKIGIESVIMDTGLRGRWETMSTNPLIICETAHNEDGIRCLLEKLKEMNYTKVHIIYGCVNDKDYEKILSMLPTNARYYFCKPSVPRGLEVDTLYKSAEKLGLYGYKYNSIADAIDAAKETALDDEIVVITGSIFLVADAIAEFEKELTEGQESQEQA